MVYIKFTNKQNLKKHIEAVHEGIKPFKCSICDVKFANNYNPLIQERYLLSLQINKKLQSIDSGMVFIKFANKHKRLLKS